MRVHARLMFVFMMACFALISPASASADSYDTTVLNQAPHAYFKLDELGGTTAVDASGNGNNLTLQGSATWNVSGSTGTSNAVQFNGAGMLLNTTPLNQLDNFAISGWAQPSNLTGVQSMFGLGFYWGWTYGTFVWHDAGAVKAGGSGNQFSAGGNVSASWQHIVVQRTAGTTEVWINGVKQPGSTTVDNGYAAGDWMSIGGIWDSQNSLTLVPFTGAVDNVAFFKHTLSQADIDAQVTAGTTAPVNTAAPAVTGAARPGRPVTVDVGTWSGLNPTFTYQWQRRQGAGAWADITGATSSSYTVQTSDLGYQLRVQVTATNSAGAATESSPASATVAKPTTHAAYYEDLIVGDGADAYFPLDEASGTVAQDMSGNGMTLNAIGTVTWGASGAFAGSTAARLNEVGLLQSNTSITYDSDYTMEAWARADQDANPNGQVIVGSGYGWSGFIYGSWVWLTATGTVDGGSSNFPVSPSGSPAFGDNLWRHVVVRRQGGVTELFVDGVKLTGSAAGLDPGGSQNYLSIGGLAETWPGPYRYLFDGNVDNVAFYETALSDTQIANHAAADVIAPQITVAPSVSGTAEEGQTLAAADGTWFGGGTITTTRQWQRETSPGVWADITGETSSTYVLGAADVGKKIRVNVTATNSAGSTTEPSAATADVVPLIPQNTSAPTVTGTAVEGQTLTAADGTWVGSGAVTVTRQWQRETSPGTWADITGETASTYALAAADVGKKIRVNVTATNANGSTTQASAATAEVLPLIPQNTSAPTVTGTAVEGQTLTAADGTWVGTGTVTVTRQWQRETSPGVWADITGETASTYALAAADVGKKIRVNVTATNSNGSTTQASTETATVTGTAAAPANTAAPTVTGTAVEGQTLTAAPGTWTGTPTYTYQWQRETSPGSWADITGATSGSFTLTGAEADLSVRVRVTATNVSGSATASSAGTAPVTAAAPQNTAAPTITGTPKLGETLTVTPGAWTGANRTLTVIWKRCSKNKTGCKNVSTEWTYALGVADINHLMLAEVTATNSGGSDGVSVWAGVPVGVPGPKMDGPPKMEGGPQHGAFWLTDGQWQGHDVEITKGWQRETSPGVWVDAGSGDRYDLGPGDAGKRIRGVVRASNADDGGEDVIVITEPCPVPTTNPSVITENVEEPGHTIEINPGTWPDGVNIGIRWERQDENGQWKTIEGETGRKFTPDNNGTYRAVIDIEDNGVRRTLELDPVVITDIITVSRVRMTPRPLLGTAATRHKRAAMKRSCLRRSKPSQRACLRRVDERFAVKLRWDQSAPANVTFEFVRGDKVLGRGSTRGRQGRNAAQLSRNTVAKLNKVSWYQVRFYLDKRIAKRIRFTVRPSVQLIHAPGRKHRRLVWWQDQRGKVTVKIARNGKTVLSWKVDGRPGKNRLTLTERASRRLKPGKYQLQASFQVDRLRSFSSKTTITVR